MNTNKHELKKEPRNAPNGTEKRKNFFKILLIP